MAEGPMADTDLLVARDATQSGSNAAGTSPHVRGTLKSRRACSAGMQQLGCGRPFNAGSDDVPEEIPPRSEDLYAAALQAARSASRGFKPPAAVGAWPAIKGATGGIVVVAPSDRGY